MSIIPAFRAALKRDITEPEKRDLEQNVRKLRGVVGTSFGQAANGEKYMHVTYMPGNGVERIVATMDGVTRTFYSMS